jgi:hypothetical protein
MSAARAQRAGATGDACVSQARVRRGARRAHLYDRIGPARDADARRESRRRHPAPDLAAGAVDGFQALDVEQRIAHSLGALERHTLRGADDLPVVRGEAQALLRPFVALDLHSERRVPAQ